MKTLILIRHAKSSWEYSVDDHDRPLKKRGENDAKLVSDSLTGKFIMPDLIMSSTANRAKSTAKIFLKTLGVDLSLLKLTSDLYDFHGDSLTRTIKNTHNGINSLMIFGHNYALTNFANRFGSKYIENVTTSGLVEIQFNINSWKDIEQGNTVNVLFPRDLK